MKICILGLGVIGTTYGYAFQKAGHQVEHLVRENKKQDVSLKLDITILDGRYDNKGEEKTDIYTVKLAKPDTSYDFIFLSVASGRIKDAIETLSKNNVTGSLVLFCNFWNRREEIEEMMDMGIQVLIVNPVDSSGLEEVLEKFISRCVNNGNETHKHFKGRLLQLFADRQHFT